MTKHKQMFLSGGVGAAIAAAVVVTVYEGHVVAETRGARTELAAGTRATLGADGTATVAAAADRPDPIAGAVAFDPARATREELVARTTAQQAEIATLKTQLATLEQRGPRDMASEADEGRPWYDPSPETLARWAAECQVRADEPNVDRWRPLESLGRNNRGLEPSELSAYNAAIAEVQQQWKRLVRALYIEATGDVSGADTLSTDAMRGEIMEKSPPGEHNVVMQKISAERAGLAQPPADLSKTTPLERLIRAYVALGDQTEAALAKRLGPERAEAIRGDGWDSRSNWAGCPDPAP